MPAPEKPEESGSSPSPPGDDPAWKALRRALSQPLPESTLSFFRRKGAEERSQPAPGLAAGKVVGDFRLVSLIGQGGMGQIWEAEQLSLHRTVASWHSNAIRSSPETARPCGSTRRRAAHVQSIT